MTVVLVHGAWHGAWAWAGVVAALDGAGVTVSVAELPFTGFPEDAATARDLIERAGPGAVVCGHSYGGLVISAAARGLPVQHLVYLCAFMVDEGEDPWSLWFSRPVPLHEALVNVDGRTAVDPSRTHECFYGDADEATVATILPRLRTIPGATGPPIDDADPAWRHVPSTYVVCRRDRAIHPDVQRVMARHASSVVEWDADHSPFLSQPQRVASLLAGLDPTAAARERGTASS